MVKSREHFALDWIKGELLETLNDARETLESYVESDRDGARIMRWMQYRWGSRRDG